MAGGLCLDVGINCCLRRNLVRDELLRRWGTRGRGVFVWLFGDSGGGDAFRVLREGVGQDGDRSGDGRVGDVCDNAREAVLGMRNSIFVL